MIGLHRDQQALLIAATTAGLCRFFFFFCYGSSSALRLLQVCPDMHEEGHLCLRSRVKHRHDGSGWRCQVHMGVRAHTLAHTHSAGLGILQLRRHLARLSDSKVSGIYEIHTICNQREHPRVTLWDIWDPCTSFLCLCVCAFVCSTLTLRFLLTKLFPPKPNTLPWIYCL